MIPSLLQIPSAVSDSKLHSVLPNNGKGDFQFDRSTGATRINRDGLIEEVGYFSSELVQNGNFSELGSELVTNGDFATNSDWVVPTGWSINNGKAIANFSGGATGRLSQTGISFVQNKTYKVVFTISDYEQGSIRIEFRQGGGNTVSANYSGNGTYTLYQVAGYNHTQLSIRGLSDAVLKVDNVSVKQVDPNDDWEPETSSATLNFADFEGKSQVAKINILNSNTSARVRQPFNYVSGTKYKISVEVYLVSGSFRVDTSDSFVAGNFVSTTTTGSWITLEGNFDAISTGSNYIWLRSSSAVSEFYVSNISIVEVQGDRPRLSYDITNGVVEDKPHLLLENSSTNLLTFSEDFTQSEWTKSNTTVTSNIIESPQGLLNASLIKENSSNVLHWIGDSVSVTSGSSYSISVFAKKKERSVLQIVLSTNFLAASYANYDLDSGVVSATGGSVTAKIVQMQNDWYRCILSFTATATNSGTPLLAIQNSTTASRGATYQGDGASGLYLYGAMFEQQSYATSYIPTAGTTITRAAETCEKSNLTNHIGQTEGTVYCEIDFKSRPETGSPIIGLVTLNNNVTNLQNCILLGIERQSGGINRFYPIVQVGNSTVASIIGPTLTDGNYKAAFTYRQNDFSLYVNGDKIGVDTSGAVPTTSQVLLGRRFTTDSFILGDGIKGAALYNQVLSESQLMQLTGVTASSIYNNFVTRTASFTVEALNEVKKVIDNL